MKVLDPNFLVSLRCITGLGPCDTLISSYYPDLNFIPIHSCFWSWSWVLANSASRYMRILLWVCLPFHTLRKSPCMISKFIGGRSSSGWKEYWEGGTVGWEKGRALCLVLAHLVVLSCSAKALGEKRGNVNFL